jgi:hypothetical protein
MAQPFITLRLVDEDGGVARRIGVNAAQLVSYVKFVTDFPGSDNREGIANSIVVMAGSGNKLYVRETPAEIQSLLAVV